MSVLVVVLPSEPVIAMTAGANGEEGLHFACDDRVRPDGALQLVRVKPGRTKHHVEIETVDVVLSEEELYAERCKLAIYVSELLRLVFVAGGHVAAAFGKQADQRKVADADADGLSFQAVDVFVQSHVRTPHLTAIL